MVGNSSETDLGKVLSSVQAAIYVIVVPTRGVLSNGPMTFSSALNMSVSDNGVSHVACVVGCAVKERRLTLLLLLLSQRPDGLDGVSTACVLTPQREDDLKGESIQGPLHTEAHARLAMLDSVCCMLRGAEIRGWAGVV